MRRPLLLACTAFTAPAIALAQAPDARPQGGSVVAGQASISQTATRTQVNQTTDRAVIEWQQFNIGSGHQVDIRQPSASSFSVQRVTGPDPSAIAGRLTSNGGVALVNPNGVVFSNGAQVDVAALIATTADISNENAMAGRMAFDRPGRPGARVENQGSITVREQGLAALVGPSVANSGTIRARMGRVALMGAEAVTLDLAGDGLLALDVTRQVTTTPSGATALVTNTGAIEAQGGAVLLSADAASGVLETLVVSGGRITADSATLRARGGSLRLEGEVTARSITAMATDEVRVAAPARIEAPGGRVNLGTDGTRRARRTVVERGASVTALGGDLEISSAGGLAVEGRIDAARVVVDPVALHVVESLSGSTEPAEIAASTVAGVTGDLTLVADSAIRVTAALDKAAGGLTLQTTTSGVAGIALEGPVTVAGDLTLRTAGAITNSAFVRAGGALRATGGSLTNTGTLRGAGEVVLTTTGGLANTGRIEAMPQAGMDGTGTVRLSLGGSLTNDGLIEAAGALGITAGGALANAGAIRSGLMLPADGTAIDISTGAALASTGEIRAAIHGNGGIRLRAGGTLTLSGTTSADYLDIEASGGSVMLAGGLTEGRLSTHLAARDAILQGPEARLATGALTLSAAEAALGGAGNTVFLLAGANVTGGLTLATEGALALVGPVSAGHLELSAGGAIAQSAPITAGTLRLRAADEVRLDAGNAVERLGGVETAGLFSLTTSTGLVLDGPVLVSGAAGRLVLNAGGSILQGAAAPVTAARLAASSTGGEVRLDAAENLIGRLEGGSAASRFGLASSGTLDVMGAVTGTDVALRSGGALHLGAGVTAERNLALSAEDSLTQAAALSAGMLTLSAADAVLEDAGNRIGALGASTLDSLSLVNRGGLNLTGPVTVGVARIRLDPGDPGGTASLTQDSPGAPFAARELHVAAPFGAVRLDGANNSILSLSGTAREALVVHTTSPLTLVGPTGAAVVELRSQGDLLQDPGAAITAGLLRAMALGAGVVVLDEPGNAVAVLGASRSDAAFTLSTSGSLELEGLIASPQLRLTARGSITQAEGARIEAAYLGATSLGGSVTLTQAGNQVALLGPSGADGNFALVSAEALMVGGALDAGGTIRLTGPALSLEAPIVAPVVVLSATSGDLVQGANGALSTASLSAGASGSVRLSAAGNTIASLARLAANEEASLATLGALALTGPVRARLLALSAGEALTQSAAAPIVAERLDIASARGEVALEAPGNIVALLGQVGAPGGLAFSTASGLMLMEALSAPRVSLRAVGDIRQSPGGAIATPVLRATSTGGAVLLDHGGNAVESLGGSAAGEFRLATGTGLILDGPLSAGSTLSLWAAGGIMQGASGAALSAARLEASAGGTLELEGEGNAIGTLGAMRAAGRLSVLQGGATPLRLAGVITAPEMTLSARGGILQEAGALRAESLRLASQGEVRLLAGGAANAIGALDGALIGGAFSLASSGGLAVTGAVEAASASLSAESLTLLAPLSAPGRLALRAEAGGISQVTPFATISTGALSLSAAGAVQLRAAGNAVSALSDLAAAGPVALETQGALAITGPVLAPEFSLSASGSITQAAGAAPLVVERLSVHSATGGVALDGEGNDIARLAGGTAATRFALATTGSLALSGAVRGEEVALSAGGTLSQSASGAGITAGILSLSAGEVRLLGAGNSVARLAGVRSETSLDLATTGSVSVTGLLEGQRVTLRSGDIITLDGAQLVLGEAALLAAPGGIAAGARSSLTGRGGALNPALVLDTRSLGGLTALPAYVLPDVVGIATPTRLSAFGAATPVVSGPIRLDLAAGNSPVFLLMGAGRAEGQLSAGRLGVMGLGGAAALGGSLGGFTDARAAALVEVTSQLGGPAQAAYAFNLCAMGSAGCAGEPPPDGGNNGGGEPHPGPGPAEPVALAALPELLPGATGLPVLLETTPARGPREEACAAEEDPGAIGCR